MPRNRDTDADRSSGGILDGQRRRRRLGSSSYDPRCCFLATAVVLVWVSLATVSASSSTPRNRDGIGEEKAEDDSLPSASTLATTTTTAAATASTSATSTVVVVQVGADGSTQTTDESTSSTNSNEISGRSDRHAEDKVETKASPFRCGIYLAPSTIPGAGIGVFTGVDRSAGDLVGSGDAIIPVVDVQYHLQNYPGYRSYDDDVEQDDDDGGIRPTVEFTVDYVWNGVEMGMARETAFGTWNAEGVTAYCPGLDAAINCHLALVNVDKSYPQYDALHFHRSKDPGAGAFSPYHNCTTVATTNITAGAELFKFYGENWFVTRSETFPNVPLNDNYNAADELIRGMDELLESLQLTDDNASASTSSTPSQSTTIDKDLYRILTSSPYQSTSRTLTALPSPQHLETARQSGVRSTNQVGATRSLPELQQHGQCVDTIRPGVSTIPQAGRGAFAKTDFRAGEVVTGTPLLVCDSLEYMTLYDGDWWERSVPPTKRKVGNQLVLNYCHQHPSSPSLFLCPYGYLVNYINHAPTTTAQSPPNHGDDASNNSTFAPAETRSTSRGTPTANVKLVWAVDGVLGHNASLLDESPRSIVRASPGLFWHYVATRGIREGDEILLDYGELWQRHWDQHVRDFDREHRHRYDSDYLSAREYNLVHANATLRTAKEQARSPYPGHLELRCLNELGANGTSVLSTLTSERALELWTTDNVGSRCSVVGRDWQHDRYLYRVEVEYQVWDTEAHAYRMDSTRVAKRVERSALRFFDVPYSTDLFLPTAFRHPLGIPDDMFPAAWRNYHGYHRHRSATDAAVTAAGRDDAPNDLADAQRLMMTTTIATSETVLP